MEDTTQLSLILQRASLSKHLSPELKTALTELSKEATVVCSDIAADIEKQNIELLRCSSEVSRATTQSEVQVKELMTCLKSAIESCKCQQDQTTKLQTNIYAQLGSCGIELEQSEKDIGEKGLQKKQHENDIQAIQSQIASYEWEAFCMDSEARRLGDQASVKEGQRNTHYAVGLVGTGLLAFGSFVTGGGLAVACAGAAAANAAVNAHGVVSCNDAIRTLEAGAGNMRWLAWKAMNGIMAKQREKARLEKEIEDLRVNIGELKQTIDILLQIDKLLCTRAKKSGLFITVVGDLCAALDEARLKTSIIEIDQNMIAKDPIEAQKINVQIRMDDFKNKWEAVQSLLKTVKEEAQGQIGN